MTSQSAPGGTDLRTWAIAVWVLYLASYLTGITAIVGVIIAYVKRQDAAGTPYASHMTYAIRTFWISLIIGIIGAVLSLVLIGYLILLALVIWQLFRFVRGLIRAIDGRPIEDPEGWL